MDTARDYASTTRFSDRVDDYERYRPGYPPALTDWLVEQAGLEPGDAVADIGAGTGLFTRDLLNAGFTVYGVEPNAPMRAVALRQLASHAGFVAVDGSAERTTLPAGSIRLITAAQAFHWFDPLPTRAEFARIAEPGGGVALIWNVRRIEGAFAVAYEDLLLSHCPDYAAGVPRQADPAIVRRFFAGTDPRQQDFDYAQRFDFAGLRGRLLSSSYTPKDGDALRPVLLERLRQLFDAHAVEGHVRFEYDTRVFFGRVRS